MKQIKYKVVYQIKDRYESIFALTDDVLDYKIGEVTEPKRVPRFFGYYIAVFQNLAFAKIFVEKSCGIIPATILKVEVWGKHEIKRLPKRRYAMLSTITSLFDMAKPYTLFDDWPDATELWEYVKPIEVIQKC